MEETKLPDTQQSKKQKILIVIAAVLGTILVVFIVLIISLQLKKDDSTAPEPSEASGSCTEACPHPDDKGLLVNCTDSQDSDGDESLCSSEGREEMCGGELYCCPAAGGNWELCSNSTPSTTPTPTEEATPPPEGYNPADYNQSGNVDINDFALFVGYYEQDDLKADLTGNGQIGIDDFTDGFVPPYKADNS